MPSEPDATNLLGERVLLRIYLRTADRAPYTPTNERIVKAARAKGLLGATVIKGILGFGSHGTSRAKLLAMTEHVPVIVEIVDSAERIQAFLADGLPQVIRGGLVTLERASVMMYRHRDGGEQRAISIASPQKPLVTAAQVKAGVNMTINEDGVLLRVFIGESDRHAGRPLYEAIVQKARELGLAGATVLRGVEGFGANSVVHKAALLEMSTDLPIVIEIVDRREKIELLLPHVQTMVSEGMITMEYVAIVAYRHDPNDAPQSSHS